MKLLCPWKWSEGSQIVAFLILLALSYVDLYWVGLCTIGVVRGLHSPWLAILPYAVWAYALSRLCWDELATRAWAVVVGLLWPFYPAFFIIWAVWHFGTAPISRWRIARAKPIVGRGGPTPHTYA